MIRSDYRFGEESFVRTPLDAPLTADLQPLVAKLMQRQVTVLTGAGASAGKPSELPVGREVARLLRQWALSLGMTAEVRALANPDDLGEVAEIVEDRFDHDTLTRQLLAMVNWLSRRFNLGHLAIALLYAERVLHIGFTANWDVLVKRASETVEHLRLACPCDRPTLAVAASPLFIHLHGDAEHPETLVATNRHLSAPEAIKWTQPQLAAALISQELLLVGFAAEPNYVLETIKRAVDATGTSPVAVLSFDDRATFIAASPELAEVTGVDVEPKRYVRGDSSERLGDVLRAYYAARVRDVLDEAERRAGLIAKSPLALTPPGVTRVRQAVLGGTLANFLGLLWRAAQLAANTLAEELQPTLETCEDPLADALATAMILASCPDVIRLEARREGCRVTLADGSSVDLWIVVPREKIATSEAVTQTDSASAQFAYPGDAATPLILLCARTVGLSPGVIATVRLAGSGPVGKMVSPHRHPVDALTLNDLEARCPRASGTSANFHELVNRP